MKNEKLSLEEVKNRVVLIAETHAIDINLLPLFDRKDDYANYIVSMELDGFHYYHSERGVKSEEKITTDLDELLFWIFKDVTDILAFDFELKNRIEGQDFRLVAFKKHIELLLSLNLNKKYIDELKLKYNRLLNTKLL